MRLKKLMPRSSAGWEEQARRYGAIEARYAN